MDSFTPRRNGARCWMYHEGDRKVLTRCGRNSSSMDIALTPTMFARRVREKCTALRRDAKDLSEMVLALHGPPSQNGQMLFVRSAKALRDAATFFLEMLQNADVTASPKWMLSLKRCAAEVQIAVESLVVVTAKFVRKQTSEEQSAVLNVRSALFKNISAVEELLRQSDTNSSESGVEMAVVSLTLSEDESSGSEPYALSRPAQALLSPRSSSTNPQHRIKSVSSSPNLGRFSPTAGRSSSDNADRPSSLNFSIRKTHTSMSYSTSSPLRTAVESSGCGGSAPAHRKKSMSCNITLNRIDEPVRGSGLRSADSAAFDEFVAPPPTHSPPPPPTTAQLSPTSSSGSHASSDFSLPSSPLILHTPPATPPPSTHRPSFAVGRVTPSPAMKRKEKLTIGRSATSNSLLTAIRPNTTITNDQNVNDSRERINSSQSIRPSATQRRPSSEVGARGEHTTSLVRVSTHLPCVEVGADATIPELSQLEALVFTLSVDSAEEFLQTVRSALGRLNSLSDALRDSDLERDASALRMSGVKFVHLAKELISKGEECDDADKERLRRQRIAVERCVTHSYHLLANKKQSAQPNTSFTAVRPSTSTAADAAKDASSHMAVTTRSVVVGLRRDSTAEPYLQRTLARSCGGSFLQAKPRLIKSSHTETDLNAVKDASPLRKTRTETCGKALSDPREREGGDSSKPKPSDRDFRLNEIVISERSYFKSLQRAVWMFKKPMLEDAKKENGRLSPKEVELIFSNLENVYAFTKRLLKDIEKVLKNPSLSVGDVFIQMAPMMKLYTQYVNNYDISIETLAECRRRPEFAAFLDELLEKSGMNLNLASFLIMPVQRLPRYEMLLKELLKFTPKEHADYDNLTKALTVVKEIADLVNENKRKAEQRQEIVSIQQQIINKPNDFSLVQPNRSLVRRTEVWLKGRETRKIERKRRFVFLFNDVLLVTKPVVKREKEKEREMLEYRAHLPLTKDLEVDVMQDGDQMEDECMSITYTPVFTAAGTSSLKDWMEETWIFANSDDRDVWYSHIRGLLRINRETER